jgi:hypothetical protein
MARNPQPAYCPPSRLTKAQRRDAARGLAVLRRFAEVYCRRHHGTAGSALCADCAQLVAYAQSRLLRCPYDPKPKCKNCPTHCYQPSMRARVKEIMKYSGMYYVRRGRLDWLAQYFLS